MGWGRGTGTQPGCWEHIRQGQGLRCPTLLLEVQRRPPCQVGAQGQVHILHHRVTGPAAGISNGLSGMGRGGGG